MQPTNPSCPYCGKAERVVKAGLNGTGSQRMRCPSCHRYFTPLPKPMGYDQATRELAVGMYLEGMSFRGIGKVLNIHYVIVINWVNAHAKALPDQVVDQDPTDTIETDELFNYIGEKRA